MTCTLLGWWQWALFLAHQREDMEREYQRLRLRLQGVRRAA